ncbi:MAG TPA: MlaD family protein [Chitinispirillaceae bacterium]|nr:MlaD family protein [Chitinispirillaceae bacterium]
MSDKTLGYGVLITLILFLFIPASYLIWKTKSSVHLRTIQFEQIQTLNFLNKQDPVRINGVIAGSIRKIDTKDNKTFAQITTNQPITLYKDYKITSTMKGILGERFIDIDPGNPQSGSVGEKVILKGFFISGVSDAIAYMNKLDSIVISIVELSNRLRFGSSDNVSFIHRFDTIVSKFDSLIIKVNTFSNLFDSKLDKGIDTLNIFLKKTSEHTKAISSSIPDLIKSCETLLCKADQIVFQLDTLITKGDSVVSSMNRSDKDSWKEYFEKIQINLRKLREFIEIIQSEELKLPVRL